MSTTRTRYHRGVPVRGGALHIVLLSGTWYAGLRVSPLCSGRFRVNVLEQEHDGPDPMSCRACLRSLAVMLHREPAASAPVPPT